MSSRSDDARLRWATVSMAAAISGAAVPAQYWLGEALADGDFGRTPDWAVFGPLVIWIVADIFIATLVVRARRIGKPLFIAYLAVLAVCLVGTYLSWSVVASFLRVA